VWRADRFVHLALLRPERDSAQDGVLRRQLCRHRRFRAPHENGRMRVVSWRRRTGSPFFSIGVQKRRVKFFRESSSPGIRKANCDHSSPRLFSIGVPDRHSRWRVSSRHTACVTFAVEFFIACASSNTTRCQESSAISTISRANTA
jgi:hypothetical protein